MSDQAPAGLEEPLLEAGQGTNSGSRAAGQAVASALGGSWGGRCLRMAHCVRGPEASRGAPAAGAR